MRNFFIKQTKGEIMNSNKKELFGNVMWGIGMAMIVIAFVVVYVYFTGVNVTNKVVVNYVPKSYDITASNSANFVSAVKSAKQSVVEINATLPNGLSAGSGVIYSTSNVGVTYIITNFHVIDGANAFKVILHDGEAITNVQLVGGDEKQDIAVLMVEGTYLQATVRPLEEGNELQLGETVFAIGNPLGRLGGSVTKGIISCLDREITVGDETMNLLQTDVAINSGNSGGGLFDENGNLVGIVNAKVSSAGVEGLAFAISIDNALKVANELIETSQLDVVNLKILQTGYVQGRIELGFSAKYTSLTINFFMQTEPALYVTSCNEKLQAYSAGLRQYDKIVSIAVGGVTKEMTSEKVFKDFVATLNVGDSITINVVRNSETLHFTFEATQKIYNISK